MLPRKLLALVLLPAAVDAAQSLSAGWGSGTLPTGAPYTNLSNFRIEFRIHNWSSNGNYQTVLGTNSFVSRISPSGQVFFTSWQDASSACYVYPVIGTDVIVRFQRDSANSRLTCEAFSTATGAVLSSNTAGITQTAVPNDSGNSIWGGMADLAYVRGYNTVVPMGTPPGNTYNGNLYDYEFNGNGTDQSNHANLTMMGAAYTTTPVYPPAVVMNPWPAIPTFRAGTSIQLNGAASFTATDNSVLTYFWQQMPGGPSTGNFSSRTSATPSFSATIAGSYPIQLTVTDTTGLSSSTQGNVGAVSTDQNSVVITGLAPEVDYILGPIIMAGSSPWPYFDLAEIGTARSLATAALANPPSLGPAISGTVTVTTSPITLIGTGTHFTTELTTGQQVIVAFDSIDGPGTGRYVDSVTQITDDTHATLTQYTRYFPSPTAATVYLAPPNTATFQLNWWDNGYISTFWNFYDTPLALYRLYYRTGDNTFLNEARQMADYNWQWMSDFGYATPPPRGSSLLSQFVRAMDGHPERLPMIYAEIGVLNGLWLNPSSTPNIDLRESGYEQWFTAIGSKVDADPTRHAQYCSWLTTSTPQWIAAQYPDGHWGENVYAGSAGYPYPPLTISPLVFGASPWRTSILIKGLEATYDALNDTSAQGCNNPAMAASLLTSIQNVVAWQWNYGRDSRNRGIFYDTQYPGNAQAATFPGGTVSVNLNSTAVTGVGTSFTKAYACNGTDFIGFNTTRTIYQVVSCADDTHLTITPAFGAWGSAFESSNLSGSSIDETPPSSTSCGTSLATWCFVSGGDLNLDRLVPGDISWLYYTTQNPLYLTWADDFFSAAFGGPASGPNSGTLIGQIVGNPAGPNALGYIGDNVADLPDCNAPNPAPCVPGGNAFSNMGKNFSEASGAPAADNELAWRLNGLSRPNVQIVYLDSQLASVKNAAQVSFTVTQPSGTVTTQVCAVALCPVQVDARQGNHLVTKTYLSATGSVLATSQPTVIIVQ